MSLLIYAVIKDIITDRRPSVAGPRPNGERGFSARAAATAAQLPLEVEKPRVRRTAAQQELMGDCRPVTAMPARGLDQMLPSRLKQDL